ncbi:teichoic acid transport system permease protein [Enterococcus sp. PF1-24]|uniref:ABC transporter permease n=1 Tax=unclassified Enterococcus TaxID=2608891 RepID=UPI002473501D|nr:MULTISPECIES: ABC transporter permease [unclassified Enterococcus]MDH6364554.1 teichoic acid transport system permease protein [Enterococcus sp. PFB1-1]MDH6401655.1 teichoic acid transport system permease protein [Enterococcus sp. PF1-24]
MFTELKTFVKEIYQNKRLLLQFSFNDFRSRYAGSTLGMFWAFANPVVTVVTYWFVFGMVFKNPNQEYPQIVLLLTGLVPWFYFSDVLGSGTGVYREYSYLVKKVVFNIRILPTAKLISNLYIHGFFVVIALGVTISQGFMPTLQILQIFYYLFCLMMFLTGLTWITSSIQPFLPDINQFIAIIMQALMWGTPVLWDISSFANHPTILFLLKFNPLYYVVQGYRSAFLNQGWFWEHWALTAYFWGVTFILLIVGSLMFKRLRPHFSDVL